jgi:hypothetical protein
MPATDPDNRVANQNRGVSKGNRLEMPRQWHRLNRQAVVDSLLRTWSLVPAGLFAPDSSATAEQRRSSGTAIKREELEDQLT